MLKFFIRNGWQQTVCHTHLLDDMRAREWDGGHGTGSEEAEDRMERKFRIIWIKFSKETLMFDGEVWYGI